MIKVIHDSVNALFRNPTGALHAGSPVLLTLLLARDFYAPDPVLHMRFDKDNAHQVIRMHHRADAGHENNSDYYHAWTVSFTPDRPGLYWYWFELCSDTEVGERYGWHEGADNSWDEGPENADSEISEGYHESEGSGDSEGASFGHPEDERHVYRHHPVKPWEGPFFIGSDPTTGQAVLTDSPAAWQITAFEPAYEDVDWIWGGVFYHVFVDRFASSGELVYMDGKTTRDDWGGMPRWQPNEHGEILNNDFFGGNLAGIREKLPYLEDLGVTCLYLSPIFEAYSSHKYDTSNYMKVDPMFGDEEGFTSLCKEAAERGIRVICDGVFSHTGSDSLYFDINDRYGNGACHHPDSPYRDWYYFEHGSWQSWWGIKTLPRVNKDNPSYQDFISGEDGVIRHWLRAGASGWRLDVVDELPRRFLEKMTEAAKAEKPDALMLGEVWEDASNKIAYDERKNYFEGDKLDSVMNYPLRRGLIDYVRSGDAQLLAHSMRLIMDHYPLRVVHALMNILGTHDTERIITALAGRKLEPDATRAEKAAVRMDADQWAVGVRRLKIAVVLQMTLPGVPCVYYGDEAGMEGYADPFNRRCYPWGHENRELLDWYRRVIRIRRSSDVYRDGNYRLLTAQDGFFAFERAKAGAGRRITITNCGQIQHILSLHGVWRDMLSGMFFQNDVTVLPGQAMVLRPE